jgi:hypothetical protein
LIGAPGSRCGSAVTTDRKLLTRCSRQMASRDGIPVAAGFTFPPLALRLARACGVSFTSMAFDMKLGFCPGSVMPIGSAMDPGCVVNFDIARAYTVDRKNKETAAARNTTVLKDLSFILLLLDLRN